MSNKKPSKRQKLTDDDVREIRDLYRKHGRYLNLTKLGEEYGVNHHTVARAARGFSHKRVADV